MLKTVVFVSGLRQKQKMNAINILVYGIRYQDIAYIRKPKKIAPFGAFFNDVIQNVKPN